MIALLLWLGCAPRVWIAPPAAPVQAVEQFALTRGDAAMAGLAAVHIDGPVVTLDALSPSGVSLFRVIAGPDDVQLRAPDPAWEQALAAIPFRRDLLLVHAWSCPSGRCAVDGGVVRQRQTDAGVLRRYRGKGGGARVLLTAGRAELHDRLRGYRITLVGEAIDVP